METTSPPLNFPLDEIHYRVEHIKNFFPQLVIEAKELQKRIQVRNTLADREEKSLMDRADSSMEDVLVQYISKKFVNDFFLCEHVGEIIGKNDYRWVIDAVDGAMNFIRGVPLYGISIAIQYRNQVVAGVVIIPEFQDIYHSIYGQGAFKNNDQIHVSKINTIDRSILISSFPTNRKSIMREIISEISAFVKSGRSVRRTGSIVLDLCWIAEGKFDGLWERDVRIFDAAAAGIILAEAGGKLTDFYGEPSPNYPTGIIASNGHIHPQITEILKRSREELNLN
ncbi:MAG: inositol monophosphatase [Leptospiraceae bacterium]|nr:inositol monophosphatase [Leptospiraceae bacterium]